MWMLRPAGRNSLHTVCTRDKAASTKGLGLLYRGLGLLQGKFRSDAYERYMAASTHWGVPFFGVLIIRFLLFGLTTSTQACYNSCELTTTRMSSSYTADVEDLFGFNIRAPGVWKLPEGPRQIQACQDRDNLQPIQFSL